MIGDDLDRACDKMYGHTNWAYFDTLTPDQQEDAFTEDQVVVVFFKKESDEDE